MDLCRSFSRCSAKQAVLSSGSAVWDRAPGIRAGRVRDGPLFSSLCQFDLRKPDDIEWEKYAVQNQYWLEMNTNGVNHKCNVAGNCGHAKGTH